MPPPGVAFVEKKEKECLLFERRHIVKNVTFTESKSKNYHLGALFESE